MKLEGTSVVVTGASRGLGEELSVAFARRGAKVVLVARSEKELERVRTRIQKEGGTAFVIAADVADKDAVHRVSGAAAALVGPIDVLVHNAGTLGPVPLELMMDTECEDVERAFAVNVLGPFRLTKAIGGSMAERKRGVVVGITSDAAVNAYETWGAYGVTKAALEQALKSFGVEMQKHGVAFVAIDPGEMDTQMHAEAVPDADRATLASPARVADKIVSALEKGFSAGFTREDCGAQRSDPNSPWGVGEPHPEVIS